MLLEVGRHFPLAWQMARPYRLPSFRRGEPYYLSWLPGGGSFGEHWTRARFDRDGVIRCGPYYNPVTVANYALYNYELLHDGTASARVPFLAQAEYLVRSQREDGAYPYEFPLPRYGVRAGWLSAMAQGLAAAALTRAHYLNGDTKYRDAAVRAAGPFLRDVCAGGVSFLRNGAVFFEEVASVEPVHILNGHLCAAFAVWELTYYGTAPFLSDLYASAVDTLEKWLDKYDAGGWSYYQLATREGERRYSTLFYHQIHIAQLHVYYAMTGRQAFLKTSERWRRSMDDPRMRARLWIDSMEWLLTGIARRTRALPVPIWTPIKL